MKNTTTGLSSGSALSRSQLASFMLMIEGSYFAISGLWPVVSMASFLSVTGPKTDLWLVRAFALVIILVGASLFVSGIMKRITAETGILAVGVPLTLLVIDLTCTLRQVLPPVYLLDAVVEGAILFGWFYLWNKGFLLKQQDYFEKLAHPAMP